METVRIALGANWWDVKAKLTVGAQRASEELSAEYLKEDESVEEIMARIPSSVKLEMNRAMVMKSTVAWSYGDITTEVFENEVPADDYEIVLKRCNELYGSVPLVSAEESSPRT